MEKTGILFVCLGNICRSPTAHGVFLKKLSEHPDLAERLEVDSAGTAAYHVGNPPDARSAEIAGRRGYDLSALRARAWACAFTYGAQSVPQLIPSTVSTQLGRRCPSSPSPPRHATVCQPDPEARHRQNPTDVGVARSARDTHSTTSSREN